jgi:hypothetical protein
MKVMYSLHVFSLKFFLKIFNNTPINQYEGNVLPPYRIAGQIRTTRNKFDY